MKASEAKFCFYTTRPASVLRVSGSDANSFLQGQFSNDLRGADLGRVTYGLWLSAKGKVHGDGYALCMGEAGWSLVSDSMAASTLQDRFDAFVVADDVSVERVEGHVLMIGYPTVTESFVTHGELFPELHKVVPGTFTEECGGALFRAVFGGCWWVGPKSSSERMREKWCELGGVEASHERFEQWRICSGIPMVPRDVGPGDLPQEAGMERYAVSFSKGCYLGQEVMARLQSIGRARRSLVLVRGHGEAPLPGAELSAGGRRVGEIRSAVRSASVPNEFLALAMLQNSVLEANVELTIAGKGVSARFRF